MANYLNELNNFVNIAFANDNNNIIPNNIINAPNQHLIFHGPNFDFSIYELRNQLRNSHDWIRMKTYVLTTIDWILYQTRNPNEQYLNSYVEQLNNQVNQVNNMIFSNHDQYILYMIMSVVNNCTRNQKKDIYNLFSNLN